MRVGMIRKIMQIEEGFISASLDKKLRDLRNSWCYSKAESNIF